MELFGVACTLSIIGQVLCLVVAVSAERRPKGVETRLYLVCILLSSLVGIADVATAAAGIGKLPTAGDASNLSGQWVTSRVVCGVQPLRRLAMLVGTFAVSRRALTRVVAGRRVVPHFSSRYVIGVAITVLLLFVADAASTFAEAVPGTHLQVLDGVPLFLPDGSSLVVDVACVLQVTFLASLAFAYRCFAAAAPAAVAFLGFLTSTALSLATTDYVVDLQFRAAFALLAPLLDVSALALLGVEVARRDASGGKRVLAARRATAAALRVGM